MKKIFLTLLWAGIICSPAFASNDFLVKVKSFACNNTRNSKLGSGSLVKIHGINYVLTSDHVLFPGDTSANVCHKIFYKGEDIEAHLMAANSMKGLALLRVDNFSAQDSLDYNKLTAFNNTPSSGFASLIGFPSAANTLLRDQNAQILNSQSSRKILPLVQQVIEVKGHSEYGMSGGALLDYQNNFIGVLSHQYLQMNLGAPSKIQNYSEFGSNGELIALVIPLHDIIAWIDAVLSNGKSEEFRMDVNEQLKRNESVVIEGVKFSFQLCNGSSGAIGGRGGDGAGIGGRGGEGAGIGGNGVSSTEICSINLSWNHDENTWSNPWPLPRAVWFEQLKQKLLSGGSAKITGLFYQGTRLELMPSIPMFSLIQKGAIPLIRVDAPFNISTESAQNLKRYSSDTAAKISILKTNSALQNYDSQDFLQQIQLLCEAVENSQWEIAFQSDIQKILNDDAWNDFLQTDFNTGVALKSVLLKMQAELNKVRI